MATINSVSVGLSGATGTGNFVGSTSPTLVTPVLGAATATSVAFSPTTGGIIGTTAADNAGAGKVGELISSQILAASPVSNASGTPKSLTSISLTAGDWDVWGNVFFLPAGTTSMTAIGCAISQTNNAYPDNSLVAQIIVSFLTGNNQGLVAPSQRINVSGTTTVYIVGTVSFGVSTMNMCGGIYARRVR